jgi:Sec-independent protein translocase protein TatA
MNDIVIVLLIVLVLVLIWRGPKTLPLLGQALGRGVKEAKREASEFRENTDPEATGGAAPEETEVQTPPAASPPAGPPPSGPPASTPPTT